MFAAFNSSSPVILLILIIRSVSKHKSNIIRVELLSTFSTEKPLSINFKLMQPFPALPQSSGIITMVHIKMSHISYSRQLASFQYQPIPLNLRLALTDPIRTAWIWGANPKGLSCKSAHPYPGHYTHTTRMGPTCKYSANPKDVSVF